ncbi:MAG TPA: hypothetical protein VGP88_06045 [Thermoplasmata archaeon]|jgi:hypothetical protein|nr:hypothetical protein [Thermoplasmata archaeon]
MVDPLAGTSGSAARAFELEIASRLAKARIPFVQAADVDGVLADFWVPSKSGGGVAIDVKLGSPRGGQLKLLESRRKALESNSKGVRFITVHKWMTSTRLSKSFVEAPNLVALLRSSDSAEVKSSDRQGESRVKKASRVFFASMPFDEAYFDTFEAMRRAARRVGAACTRVDEPEYNGKEIPDLVRERIGGTKLTVCDLSLGKQNVLYELGFSDGLGHPAVLISSSRPSELPLLVKNRSLHSYALGQTTKLVTPLAGLMRKKVGGA